MGNVCVITPFYIPTKCTTYNIHHTNKTKRDTHRGGVDANFTFHMGTILCSTKRRFEGDEKQRGSVTLVQMFQVKGTGRESEASLIRAI